MAMKQEDWNSIAAYAISEEISLKEIDNMCGAAIFHIVENQPGLLSLDLGNELLQMNLDSNEKEKIYSLFDQLKESVQKIGENREFGDTPTEIFKDVLIEQTSALFTEVPKISVNNLSVQSSVPDEMTV